MKKSIIFFCCTSLLLISCNQNEQMTNSINVANECVLKAIDILLQTSESSFYRFQNGYQLNKVRIQPYYDKVQEVKKLSDNLIASIDMLRKAVDTTQKRISDTEIQTLKKSIKEYRQKVIGFIDAKYRKRVEETIGLDTDGLFYSQDSIEQDWETHYFQNTLPEATPLILNSIKSEVFNAEIELINYFFCELPHDDGFQLIKAFVVPKSNYVLQGEYFEADVFAAAYDKKMAPEILIGSSVDMNTNVISGKTTSVDVIDGMGKIKLRATTPGIKTYGGTLIINSPSGGSRVFPFNGKYTVGGAK